MTASRSESETFDRRGHEQRIKLDQALETLDPRARHIIEKRWLINECFDHIEDYIEPGAEQARPIEQEELGAFFGISRQRIGQIEDAAIAKLKSVAPLRSAESFAEFRHLVEIQDGMLYRAQLAVAVRFGVQLSAVVQRYVAPPRWNALLINWFLLCGKDEYPTYPVFLKRAPRPYPYRNPAMRSLSALASYLPFASDV